MDRIITAVVNDTMRIIVLSIYFIELSLTYAKINICVRKIYQEFSPIQHITLYNPLSDDIFDAIAIRTINMAIVQK